MTEKKIPPESEDVPKFTVSDRRHWAREENGQDLVETGTTERLPSYVEQLKKEAEEKDQRLKEYIQAYKSKTAETDEFRQRLQRENETRLDQAHANFFKNVAPIVDNLKRALDAAKTASDFDSFKKGVEMIYAQMKREFAEQGVTVIEAEGKPFDPTHHEVCMTQETDNPALDNMVLEELEPGYLFKDKLIKPAKVKVGKLKTST